MKKLMVFAALCVGVLFGYAAYGVVVTNVEVSGSDAVAEWDENEVTLWLGDIWYSDQQEPIWKVFTTDGTGGRIRLTEYFTVGGDDTGDEQLVQFSGDSQRNDRTYDFITDWHETLWVRDPNGAWVPSSPDDGLYWGFTINVSPGANVYVDDPARDNVDFYFLETLPAGTRVTIEKKIWVPQGLEEFAVSEYPTVPEPSVFAFSGLAAIALLVLRRRK